MDKSFVSKVVIAGDSGCGKSSCLDRIRGDNFNPSTTSTIGIDWYCIKKEKNNIVYKFHVYDTSGQEAYASITTQYYRDSKICLFVYDLNNLKSLESLKKWEEEFDNKNLEKNPLKIFVGNKSEIKSIDNSELIEQLEKRGIKHIEVSAKENINIKVLENMFTEDYINNHLDNKEVDEKLKNNIKFTDNTETDCYYDLNKVRSQPSSKCCS